MGTSGEAPRPRRRRRTGCVGARGRPRRGDPARRAWSRSRSRGLRLAPHRSRPDLGDPGLDRGAGARADVALARVALGLLARDVAERRFPIRRCRLGARGARDDDRRDGLRGTARTDRRADTCGCSLPPPRRRDRDPAPRRCVAGTVLSQTLINLLALAILAAVTFASVPLLHGHLAGVAAVLAVPLALCVLVLAGPRLLRAGPALALGAGPRRRDRLRRGCCDLGAARAGRVRAPALRSPRRRQPAVGVGAAVAGLLHDRARARPARLQATLVTAAAILLAVNVTAVVPATPSNVGVFQAACLVVLAAYGVGAGQALAYGIILQAIELLTALALGVPALLREGMTWQDIRRVGRSERRRPTHPRGTSWPDRRRGPPDQPEPPPLS